MRCVEFGKENREVVLLLHGGGLGWWNYRAAAELLQGEYHVVLPLLPGHAGSDIPFTAMADAAGALIEYVDRTFGGQELRRMRRSGEKLAALIPGAKLTVLPGLAHGEFSLKHPAEYAAMVRQLTDRP